METRVLKKTIAIEAPVAHVWKAITDPETIRAYAFGTNVQSDFKKDSAITYTGIWKGKEYHDKGVITEVDRNKKLSHTHWSSLSGLEDAPENYFNVTYELDPKEHETTLCMTFSGLFSKDSFDMMSETWDIILQKMKGLLEGQLRYEEA